MEENQANNIEEKTKSGTKNKFLFTSVVAVAVLAFIIYGYEADNEVEPSVSGETIEIVLTDSGYEPSEVTIAVGTEVTFSTDRDKPHWPASNLHPTHEQYSEFDPQVPLDAEENWSFVFDKPGSWDFHDHIRSYYVGTIYVTE